MLLRLLLAIWVYIFFLRNPQNAHYFFTGLRCSLIVAQLRLAHYSPLPCTASLCGSLEPLSAGVGVTWTWVDGAAGSAGAEVTSMAGCSAGVTGTDAGSACSGAGWS